MLARMLRTSGRFLVFGAGLAIALASLTAIWWGSVPALLTAGGALLLAGLSAVAIEGTRHQSLVSAAAHLDRSNDLRDQLSSAIELASDAKEGHQDHAFVTLAVSGGESAARLVRPGRSIPLRPDRLWIVWPLLSAAAVGAALLVPTLGRSFNQGADPSVVTSIRDSIASVAADLAQNIANEPEPEPAEQAALDRVRDIERTLESGAITPDDAITQAAAASERAARELADQAQRERVETLSDRLEQINPAQTGNASDLAEALRTGNLSEAQRALQELNDRAANATDAERQQLADDLRALAEQIHRQEESDSTRATDDTDGDDAANAPTNSDKPDPPTDDATSQREPAAVASPDSAPDADPPTSAPDQASREESEQAARNNAERESGQRDAEDLADRLRDMANEMDPAQESTPDDQQDRSTQDRQPPSESAQEPSSNNPADNTAPGPTEQQPQPSEPAPDEQGKSGKPGDNAAESGDGGERSPESSPGDAKNQQEQSTGKPDQPATGGGSQKDEPGRQPTDAPQTGGEASEQATPSDTSPDMPDNPDRHSPSETSDATDETGNTSSSGDRPDKVRNEQPGSDNREEPSDQPGSTLDRALDQIEKLDRQQRESLRRQAKSEHMRSRAEELLNGATPEQRQRLADLAERFRSEAPEGALDRAWNPDTELMDARGRSDMNPEDARQAGTTEPIAPPDRESGVFRPSASPEQVQQAAAAAERAIEGQAIPRRYRDYVRSVYRRFEEQSAQPAAPEGSDAEKPAETSDGINP